MPNWIRVAAVADCPPDCSREVVVGERIVALFNVAGTFYALDGVCPHQGGPLGRGELAGCVVTCPWHGWRFDVKTGSNQLRPALIQQPFAVRVEGDAVLVDCG